ncbi:MAG TPA: MBL fold metallo-hydrolase [Chloroflexota bacterium]|nr:MBL fold metallo-hydrolase [Chloroflexota bacterium]
MTGPNLRLRFWGVRGSIPAPGPETSRYGGNTSCVTLEFPEAGDPTRQTLFILDAGTGIRSLGLSLLRQKRLPLTAHLFLSHTHWDHIQGFPFFAPAFIPGNRILVHGGVGSDGELSTVLTGQMLHRYFPVSLSELGAEISFQHTDEGTYEIAGARIHVDELHHPGTTVGYRVEIGGRTIAYCTDTEPVDVQPGLDPAALRSLPLDPNVVGLARDADVLIHDAQYTDAEYPPKVGWGHSPLSFVVRTALAARVKRLLLFHHDPMRLDDQLDTLLAEARALVLEHAAPGDAPLQVDAAAEGMEIALPLDSPVAASSPPATPPAALASA